MFDKDEDMQHLTGKKKKDVRLQPVEGKMAAEY